MIHPMTRAGLVHLIGHRPDLAVCGEAENAAKALDAVAASKPDLVLADITLPGKSGLELIKDIKAIRPGLPVLVIMEKLDIKATSELISFAARWKAYRASNGASRTNKEIS